jgi:hypothetical protein
MAIIIGHGMDALRAGQCKVETALRIRDRVGRAFPVGRVIGCIRKTGLRGSDVKAWQRPFAAIRASTAL